MVLFSRAMVYSHRLLIQLTVVSGTIWPQFATQVLTGVVSPLPGVVVGLLE